MPVVIEGKDALVAKVGEEVGVSEWVEITQEQVNTFADATGDHQWIHVDPEKAKSGPFGGTIAHGYLTLSLAPMLGHKTVSVAEVKMGINYGSNKVRFIQPVPVGSRVRMRMKVLSVEPVEPNALQVTFANTFEIEGQDKPACVAEIISRYYF